jgi:hypothetical protein
MKPAFYESPRYQQKQSSLTKANWQKGLYDHLRKQVKRTCRRKDCDNSFLVIPADPKKYCSRSCAATANNLKRSQGSPAPKAKLKGLYDSGLSVNELSQNLNISLRQAEYWTKKFKIPKRPLSKAIYLKHNPKGDPFKIKRRLTPQEKYLQGLGLGIYWGEGDKVNKYRVSVSNTDPELIKKFVEFLTCICKINTDKLRFYLTIFNDIDPEKSLKYWSKKLKVSPDSFGKVVVIPPQGKGTYRKKSKHGVCCVVFGNVKLKKWLMNQLG